jgi:hypothetical protein
VGVSRCSAGTKLKGFVGKRKSGKIRLKDSIDHFNRRKALKSETQERWGLKKAHQGSENIITSARG